MGSTLSQLTLNLAYPPSLHLPQETLVTFSLQDSARTDVAAVTLASQTLRCVGLPPSPLVLQYDPRAVDPRGTLGIQVRIAYEGHLLLINDEHVPVDPSRLRKSEDLWLTPITVPLITVDARTGQGTQGANLIEGIHGGNMAEGIHGGNRVQ